MSGTNKLVSIIVSCYNQEFFLSETLDSVLGQSYENWECIIVNDGSTDSSKEIAKKYCDADSRFKYFLKENGGISSTRNFGIRKSIGCYILPLDGDDKISHNYISDAMGVYQKSPSTKLVYSKAQMFGVINREWTLPDYSYENLLYGNMIFCSAIYKRADFDMTSGYSENMINGLEDWDFWISFLDKDALVYRLPDICFYYRVKEISRTTAIDKEIAFSLRKQIYINNKVKYQEYIPELIWNNYYLSDLGKYIVDIENKLHKITNSKAYKIGRFILSPFFIIKKYLNK